MKIIVWNSQDKCVADYHRLIRSCDVLCLLDCGQWTVPMYALQIQKGLFHWKVEHEGLSYDIFYCLEKVAFVCRAVWNDIRLSISASLANAFKSLFTLELSFSLKNPFKSSL